jgi:hypothetical protein
MARPLQLGPWIYFYYREGGHDLAFPPAHRCSAAIHLHRPWKYVLGGKTLDEMRKRKMMQRRKIVMKELGFFTLAKRALFISIS